MITTSVRIVAKKYTKVYYKDRYMKAFLQNFTLRPTCYECSFKSQNRISDITLADFWGVEHVSPEMDDDKGTSLVFIHSKKGRAFWNLIENNLRTKRENIDAAVRYNSAMVSSVPKPLKREEFMQLLQTGDWNALDKKFLKENCLLVIFKKCSYCCKSVLKKIIKKRKK